MVKVEVNKNQNIINFVFSKHEKEEYNKIIDMLYEELTPIDTDEEDFAQAFMLETNDIEISFLLLK